MKVAVFIALGRAHLDPPPSYDEKLKTSFPAIDFVIVKDVHELLPALADADVFFAPFVTEQLLAAAPNLKWYHSSGIQFGQYATDEIFRAPIMMTNARGAFASLVAERVIGATLFLTHRMTAAKELATVERKMGAMALMSTQRLKGKTMGIVGLGHNGRAVAVLAHALGMRVVATKREVAASTPHGVEELWPSAELPKLLGQSHVLVITAPRTTETEGLIGAAQLAALPKDALVINAGKPEIDDDQAVMDALASGALYGYGCDDMVPDESPLRTQASPKVVLFPHAGPGDKTFWSGVYGIFAENLRRYIKGEELRNQVNRELKY